MKESNPSPHDYPLKPQDPRVEHLLFGGINDLSLRRRGFNPRQVSNWSVSLFRGSVPEGFTDLEEFENHILSILNGPNNP